MGGLGHLDVVTVMTPEKRLTRTSAVHVATQSDVEGYEIHIGETVGPDCERAWLRIGNRPEGAASPSGQVQGCYLHGLFSSDDFRTAFLKSLGGAGSDQNYDDTVEETLNHLATHLRDHLDLEALLDLAEPV